MTGTAAGGMTSGAGGAQGAGTGDGGAAAAGPVVAACMGHAGEYVCEGASLIHCGAAADAESRVACGSEARCRVGLMTGVCGECDPGAAMCMGAMLRECDAMGKFSKVTPCPSAELCSEENKSCNPAQCGADAHKCEAGFLKKCKPDQTGFDMGVQCKSQELCSEADKRCNDCMPNTNVCEQDTLMVCGADGMGPLPMPCSAPTPRCNMGKCVQCKVKEDCMTTEECRIPSCNAGTGMCTADVAPRGTKCGGGTRVCDLLGGCQQCLDDTNCPSSQRCALYNCIDRAPIQVGLLGCGFTLSPGYDLILQSATPGGAGTITAHGTQLFFDAFTVPGLVGTGNALVSSGTEARTYTVRGDDSSGAAVSCSSRQAGGGVTTAEFNFSSSGSTLSLVLAARGPR